MNKLRKKIKNSYDNCKRKKVMNKLRKKNKKIVMIIVKE